MFWFVIGAILAVGVVVAAVWKGFKWYNKQKDTKVKGVVIEENCNERVAFPVEHKGTVDTKSEQRKFTSEHASRKRRQNGKTCQKEVEEEKIKPQDNNKQDKTNNKDFSERKQQQKKKNSSPWERAPVCPKNNVCEQENCKNESAILCSECNLHLCNECYDKLNLPAGKHCIKSKTMQKIISPMICAAVKDGIHPFDCFLRKCKHVFHKNCLEKHYETFNKCFVCDQEFKLTDILTNFFVPKKNLMKED
ncbi:hypothetical protein WDU94_006306 [Cyamophila willieti]